MRPFFSLNATRAAQPDEEQYVLSVFDPSPGGSHGLWVTHPASKNARTTVLGSVLDILSAIGGCASFDEAQARVAKLWLEHGLDKPSD